MKFSAWNGHGVWKCSRGLIHDGECERVVIQHTPSGWVIVARIPHTDQPYQSRPYATRGELEQALWLRYETNIADLMGTVL